MPELPEVEYVARQLRDDLIGRRITRAEVLWARAVEGMDPADFVARVTDRVVTSVGRRAKYLILTLDDGQQLLIHRRMSGNLVFAEADPEEPYARVVFTLDDGRRLVYTDPRKFGRVTLHDAEHPHPALSQLGPEPLEAAFTPEVLAQRLAGTRRAIKAALLDQTVVAGLGNIYADEALFLARIHPLRPASSLTRREVVALHAGIQRALMTGIEHGGTTFGRHRDAYNEAGRNLDHVQVYQRTGQQCPRCGRPIERIVIGQRGTHFCPHCQRAARDARGTSANVSVAPAQTPPAV